VKKAVMLLDKTMVGRPRPPEPAPEAAPAPRPAKAPKDYGVPLNFRVPAEFSERFRIVAVRKKLKLHQLLQEAFEVYMREGGQGR
jgi:hypothetical protein